MNKTTNVLRETDLMHHMIQEFEDEHKFMGSVLVSKGDQVLFKKSYGFANLEWDMPNEPNTKMQIASVSKQFTAAAILLLQERGKLTVNDLVKMHLPDSPATWDEISIFHMLTHTSGLHNYTDADIDAYFKPMGTVNCTPENLTELFSSKPLEFKPGEKVAYCNSGFVLLGRIIEKISGQSYADFLQKNIFQPLQMNDSGNDSRHEILKHRADGYVVRDGQLVKTELFDIALCYACGSLYSTVEDLHKWVRGLFGGKILSKSSLRQMITPFKENYGCGLSATKENGRAVIRTKGKTPGFKSVVAYYPDDDLTVVVLSNNESGAAMFEIGRMLAAITRGEEIILPRQRKEIQVPSEILSAYEGEYKLDEDRSVAIVPLSDTIMLWTKTSLTASAPIENTCWLSAESNSRFFSRDQPGVEVEFFKNNLDEVSHLVLTREQEVFTALPVERLSA